METLKVAMIEAEKKATEIKSLFEKKGVNAEIEINLNSVDVIIEVGINKKIKRLTDARYRIIVEIYKNNTLSISYLSSGYEHFDGYEIKGRGWINVKENQILQPYEKDSCRLNEILNRHYPIQ
jgi:hypothetical protein